MTTTFKKLQDITNKTESPMTSMACSNISKESAIIGTANNDCDTTIAKVSATQEVESMVSQSAVTNNGISGEINGNSDDTAQNANNTKHKPRIETNNNQNHNQNQNQNKKKNKNKNKKNKNKNKNKNNNNNNNMNGNSILLDDDNDELDCDLIGIPMWIRELMEVQPTLNIMTIGSVSHGKSTLMWGLCDEKTGRDSREIKKNMTIKLGYTSCKIYKCINCRNANRMCYFSANSSKNSKKIQCPRCHIKAPFVILVRHVSFVDCPGHAQYMGTMISAACVADGAVMVIDASKPFPSTQTIQHTSAAHLLGVLTDNVDDRARLKAATPQNEDIESKSDDGIGSASTMVKNDRIKVIVAQNKIDLIDAQKACRNVEEIRSFLAQYDRQMAQDTPVIPISAQSRLNLDALCMTMVRKYPKFSPRLLDKHTININGDDDEKNVDGGGGGGSSVPRPLGADNSGGNNTVGELNVVHSEMKKDLVDSGLQINVIRSFDVNRPCTFNSAKDIDKLYHGGVLGGAIITGTLCVGDTVCIRPGIIRARPNYKAITDSVSASKMTVAKKIDYFLAPKFEYQAIEAKVIGLKCGTKSLKSAHPGANVGVMLNIDPSLTKADELCGNIICGPNKMEYSKLPVFNVFAMSYVLLKPFDRNGFELLEAIKVNVGSSKIDGVIVEKKYALRNKGSNGVLVVLKRPICAQLASRVTITRKMNGEWRLAATGIIVRVRECVATHMTK